MRVPAGAKITAAKYRKAVLKSYPTEDQIKTYFSSNLADPKRSKYLSGDDLHYCIEEILKTHLGHTEFMVIYDIIDQDGDDKISEQEFLDFMLEQSPDVRAILAGRSPNAIVDLKVSVTRDMDQGESLHSQSYFFVSYALTLTCYFHLPRYGIKLHFLSLFTSIV